MQKKFNLEIQNKHLLNDVGAVMNLFSFAFSLESTLNCGKMYYAFDLVTLLESTAGLECEMHCE